MQKIIIVTGASSGIGLEITKRFIANGCIVHGIARNPTKLEKMSSLLGVNFYGHAVDISESSALCATFETIKKITPSIDILINNASIFKSKPFFDFSFDEISQVIGTNLLGSLYCTHLSIKLLNKNFSRIINISSVSGLHGIKNQAVYSASKFGLNGFADSVAQELSASNILMTTIYPGGVNTPLWNPLTNPYLGGETTSLLTPEQIADAVIYINNLPKNVILKELTIFPTNEWH